ncbi:hypothetical protein NQ318_022683 [Aromia moschata]|uniref:Uncharacterized protein n=1 Tax=Aromia moschata TaxID=1265417 RepID=A0AAV8X2L5_9CUCU|nr:hypothetical protein NQ318_022683 [Aromia moschata]
MNVKLLMVSCTLDGASVTGSFRSLIGLTTFNYPALSQRDRRTMHVRVFRRIVGDVEHRLSEVIGNQGGSDNR